jgi:hypothetical protein
MKLEEAIELVLELARQNIIDDPDMQEESEKQTEATNVVEDFFVNNVFDGTDEE